MSWTSLAYWLLIALWVGVAALGGVLAFYSFRSGRRTGDRSMTLLGVGFVLLSVATAVEWFGVWLVFDDLFMASLGCTALMATGFGVMVVALRMRIR